MDDVPVVVVPKGFDLINTLEGVFSTFRYAEWDQSIRKHGLVAGFFREVIECVTAYNAPELVCSREHWSGYECENLLHRHGVRIWGRSIGGPQNEDGEPLECTFSVKRRQVEWAEYILRRAGVIVWNKIGLERTAEQASGYAPGSEPPNREQQRAGAIVREKQRAAMLAERQAGRQASRGGRQR